MAGKTSVRVALNHAAIQKTGERVSDKVLRETSRQTVRYARLFAPVGRTGNLARSIKAGPIKRGPNRSVVTISASTKGKGNGRQRKDYADFVERGTYGPITPRHSKVLKFQTTGKAFRRAGPNALQGVRKRTGGTVYAMSVKGQAAQHYLRNALDLMAKTDRRVRRLP